jgi:hypothetical protein
MYTNGFLDCPRRKKKGRKNICQLFILFPKTGQHFSSGTWKLFDLLLFGRDWKKRRHTQVLLGGAIKLLLWTLGHFSLFFVNTGRKNPERERGKWTRTFFKKKVRVDVRRPILWNSFPVQSSWHSSYCGETHKQNGSHRSKSPAPQKKLENKWGEMLEQQQQQQPRRYNNSRHIYKKKSCCHPKKEEGLSFAIRIDCLFLLL